jgi:O-antigen ligase
VEPDLTGWRTIARGFLLLALPLLAAGALLPAALALPVTAVVIAPWVWRAPVRGLYFLVAAAVMVETFPLGYPDALTDRIPLFENLSNVGVPGVAASPLEALMVEVSLIAFLRRRAVEGGARLPRGPIANAYLVFMAAVLLAELHGLLAGGDLRLSLWELRPQVYGFVVFLLAGALLRTRRQLLTLGGVVLSAAVLKAVLGTYRWQFTLDHRVAQDTLLGHEDSYFLVLFVISLLAALVWGRRSLLVPLLAATPVVTVCLLANQRRSGLFALAAAVLVMALMLLRFEARIRTRVVVLLVLGTIAVGGFVTANWNQSDGLGVQLVRPIRSQLDPSASARDDSSDLYRRAENSNLRATFRRAPLTGLGFGMPFDVVTPMADISGLYPLWNVIPHNTLLWVPMRMGVLGMVGFWGLVGMTVLEAFAAARRSDDPALRATAVFAVAALVAELMVAYGDLQLESYRNLVFLGALIGAVAALPRPGLSPGPQPGTSRPSVLGLGGRRSGSVRREFRG